MKKVKSKKSKILVVGDSCIDVYVYGKCNRLCPEAPVPVFIFVKEVNNGGMSLNVLNNLKSLNSKTDIITNNNYNTIIKKRFVDSLTNQMFLRIDNDVNYEKINVYDIKLNDYDCIIISDYDKGSLNEKDIEYITNNHHLVFIDTKKKINKWIKKATFIKINKKEYEYSKKYIDKNLKQKIIITLGEDGCLFNDKIFSTKKVAIRDLSGAGDTFLAGLVSKYLKTNDIYQSIKFANKCANIVVQKKGTSIIKD